MSFAFYPMVVGGVAALAIMPRSVAGWLVVATATALGSLVWFDNGRLRFPAPVRAAVSASHFLVVGLGLLVIAWPFSVADVLAVVAGITVLFVGMMLCSTGIPGWIWRGSSPPSWAAATNATLGRRVPRVVGAVVGPTVGDLVNTVFVVGFFLSLILIDHVQS